MDRGLVAKMEEVRSSFRMLTGQTTGKRPLGRLRCRWKYNVRMDPKEIGVNVRIWFALAQVRDYWRTLVNVALNLGVL